MDLDVTALASDGDTTYACKRSLMALRSGFNIVPQEMLVIRRDTPRRLKKYNKRGYGSVIPGVLSDASRELLARCDCGGKKDVAQPPSTSLRPFQSLTISYFF